MEVVGIGDNGDFPSLGAYFDELYNKIAEGTSYKEFFMKRMNNSEQAWLRFVDRTNETLKAARNAGWKQPFSIGGNESESGEYIRSNLAVKPSQFRELVMIAKDALGLKAGVNSRGYETWHRNYAKKVHENARTLLKEAQQHGLGQMSPTGGGGKYSGNTDFAESTQKPKKNVALEMTSAIETKESDKYMFGGYDAQINYITKFAEDPRKEEIYRKILNDEFAKPFMEKAKDVVRSLLD